MRAPEDPRISTLQGGEYVNKELKQAQARAEAKGNTKKARQLGNQLEAAKQQRMAGSPQLAAAVGAHAQAAGGKAAAGKAQAQGGKAAGGKAGDGKRDRSPGPSQGKLQNKLQDRLQDLRQDRKRAEAKGKEKKVDSLHEKIKATKGKLEAARSGKTPAAGTHSAVPGNEAPSGATGTGASTRSTSVSTRGFNNQGVDYISSDPYRKRSDGSRSGNIYARSKGRP